MSSVECVCGTTAEPMCTDDPDMNKCAHCKRLDPYAPCPKQGYGCGFFEDDPCDCCTDEQRAKCTDVTP